MDQKNMKLDVNVFPTYSSGVSIISHFLVYHPKFPMHNKHAWHSIESIARCIACLFYVNLLFFTWQQNIKAHTLHLRKSRCPVVSSWFPRFGHFSRFHCFSLLLILLQ